MINKSRKSDTYLVYWAKFPHNESGDHARTLTTRNWNKMDKSTVGGLSINMVDVAEQRYAKDLNKATYYVNEIKETVDMSVKEDLLSAYEKICDISKTLEASANLVKDAMLEAENSFEEVKGWSMLARKTSYLFTS